MSLDENAERAPPPPTEARRERVQELFHAAADFSEEEQQAFLDRECGTDASLKEDVWALFSGDRQERSLLDRALTDVATGMLAAGLPSGNWLGPYRIVRLLGEGGMGVVYLAERPDLHSQVAVKVLRDAWVSPTRRERFAAERRTLAQLVHPGIAQLHDAGALPDGTPWLVMEYVNGVPLTRYCRERKADVAQRLALFRGVCDAVQYAHRHAVIHRDLKPSNILVTEEGAVKLLDFGIAKHLEALEAPVEQTQTGLRLLTPAYAAPEQLEGRNIGVHSDVYSLGVILYELLTGRLPFDLSRRTPEEAVRQVLGQEAVRPSLTTRQNTSRGPEREDVPRASRASWADLDVLCLTAMHRDPQRRYATVEALIRDVEHYLRGEPLEARPDSLQYRAGKFLRRRWRAVATLSAAALCVVVLSIAYAVRLAHARNVAVAEAARAQHVQQFMQQLFDGGDTEAGPAADLSVLTLLERGTKQADGLSSEPATQADLFANLGATFRRLGRYEKAEALLTRALDRHSVVHGGNDSSVGEDLVALGLLRIDQSRLEEAARLVREGLALEKRVLPPEHPAIARALLALGEVESRRGHSEEAVKTLEQVRALRSRPGTAPLDLAEALAHLAMAEFGATHFAAAEALYRQALALTRAQLGNRHPLVADRLGDLADALGQLGRGYEAEPLYREALAIFEEWYGPEHPRTLSALSSVAALLAYMKRFDEAEPLLRKTLAVQERLHGEMHERVGETVYALAALTNFQKRYAESIQLCRRAQRIFGKVVGEKHRLTGMSHNCEAKALLNSGQSAAGEEAARRAEAILLETLPARSSNVVWSESLIGLALLRQGRPAEAEPHVRAAYEFHLTSGYKDPAFWTDNLSQLVDIYDALGRHEEAAKFRRELQALAASGQIPAPTTP
jgi:serine/threonine protein kinase/tetratricopeptide (TPR) repeat protein